MNSSSERNNYLESIKMKIAKSNDIDFVKEIALYHLNIECHQTEIINRLKKVIEDLIINNKQEPTPIFMCNKQCEEYCICKKQYKEETICSNDDFESRKVDLKKLIELHKQTQKELNELCERKKIKRMIDSL